MPKASDTEIKEAIDFAKQVREHGSDQHHVIKVLLDLHERVSYLEPVLHAVEHYLHSGQAEHEHQLLLQSLERARQVQAKRAHQDPSILGLD